MTPYIPVYDDGVKLYGIEPPLSSPSPTPDPTGSLTPTPIVTPTPTPKPSITPTPKPTATPTPVPSGDISYNYKIVNDWGNGFQGEITVKNNSNKTYSGWTLSFNYNSSIINLWGAELVSQTGNKVIVKNPSWNTEFAPQDEITIGFVANLGSDKEAPTNYEFK